ncbi:MAG: hypothetical protein DRP63_07295 [Planctomycetota bacterium]|nr:MAG: hypothetical protein DRP63_07295 [Planctomycetota bacterium]
MRRVLPVALCLFVCVAAFAQGEQRKSVDIEELLRQLASEDWRTRKRAYKALEVVADRYVPRLKKAALSADLEVRVRVHSLLRYLRVVPPETEARLEELAKEFLAAPDHRRRAIVRKMRAIDGAANWLILSLTQKQGLEARKWAVLLHWFQFGRPFLWKERKFTVEELVLIKIVRDKFAYPAVRFAALRALARFGGVRSIVTVAHMATGKVPFYRYRDADQQRFRKFASRAVTFMLKRLKIGVQPPGRDSNWKDFLGSLTQASEEAKAELERLRRERLRKRVGIRPLLGVYFPGGDENRVGEGARIAGTKPGSGAAEAGLETNDAITSIDGWRVRCWADLVHAVRHCQIGEKVPVTFLRDGETKSIEVVITADAEKN